MFEDRVCLITGGAKGIGRAIAIDFAKSGAAAVVIADIDEKAGKATAADVEKEGAKGLFVRMDARSKEDIRAAVEACASQFGGLDVLVNNVAISTSSLTSELTVDVLDEDVWETVYQINLRSYFLATKYSAKYLKQSRRHPAIVNLSSTGSFIAYRNGVAYDTTKGAVNQFTRSIALDLSPTVRVNCVSPGTVDTGLHRDYVSRLSPDHDHPDTFKNRFLVQRIGLPEEVAKLVTFLASENALFISGANFLIDGGHLTWRGNQPFKPPVAA